jgi:type II secretion system protein I
MNKFLKSNGFTLIEVLISLVILAISLLALAGLMTTTTRNNSFGGHMTEAATLAQDRLEELRVTPWDNISSNNDQIQGATGIVYTRNWNVATNGNLRTVTITINWNDQTNRSIRILSAISQ